MTVANLLKLITKGKLCPHQFSSFCAWKALRKDVRGQGLTLISYWLSTLACVFTSWRILNYERLKLVCFNKVMIRHCVCTPATYIDHKSPITMVTSALLYIQLWLYWEHTQNPDSWRLAMRSNWLLGFSYLRWAATISSYGGSKSCWHFSSGLASWTTQTPIRPHPSNANLFTATVWAAAHLESRIGYMWVLEGKQLCTE